MEDELITEQALQNVTLDKNKLCSLGIYIEVFIFYYWPLGGTIIC